MLKKSDARNSLKTLKYRNRMMVLSYMRKSGSISVNEISRETGLSKMTVHKIIDHYLANGMVSLTGKGSSTEEGGKKPNLFAFNPNCRFIFGLRLGDGALYTAITNLNGEILARTETMLGNESFDAAMDKAKANFDKFVAANGLLPRNCLAIVVGFSGVVDADSGTCLSCYRHPSWGANLPLREALAKRFPPHIRIHVNSRWRYLAMGEALAAQEGERKRFFLIGNFGDHISGGLVENGKVTTGVNGFAGEIGHMRVTNDPSEICPCGGTGCLQSLARPGRLEQEAARLRQDYGDSRIFVGLNGGNPSFRNVFAAANDGDPLARRIMDGAIDGFAFAINNIVHICDPGTIVIYGDYAEAGKYFLGQLNEKVNTMAIANRDESTRIEFSTIGNDWDIVGAASQVTDAIFS